VTDLRKEFNEAWNFLEQGHIRPAVQQGGQILEALLRELCQNLLPKLPASEAAKMNTALEEIGKGKPLEKLTLGELVAVFYKARLADACQKYLGMNLSTMANESMVKGWVDLRNRASHAGESVSSEEAERFLVNLKALLREAQVLKPVSVGKKIPAWWEVAKPHRDILEGKTEASRFAAKLDEVVAGRGDAEYVNAKEFFSHTYMTLGLRNLISEALKRLSGEGGNGVLHLETAFGGGKTHSLIALYHFFTSGEELADLFWIPSVLEETGVKRIPAARVLTFVGTEADPQGPTPWGLFGQKLGKYELVKSHDERRQSPGKAKLRELLGEEPTLILIDEIAEFLCRLVEPQALAGGNKEAARAYQSQVLSFIHELTEVATELPRCLLVLTTTTSTAYGEEGERIQRDLKQIAGRMHRQFEPVGSEDIYEVVRRRLFEDLGDPEIHEAVAEEFLKIYRDQAANLPEEAADPKYKQKLIRAYPFHPELIDVLYNQWGSYSQFQRTRGVLRFLALVVQEGWKKRIASPLIRLSDVPLGHREVRQSLLSCIGREYESVIGCDIAGSREIARQIDRTLPKEQGELRLAEGLATCIFLYSFSGAQKVDRGATAARLRLGILTPDLPSTAVGDALQRLEENLFYLHKRDNRYFFSTELNLNRAIAEAQEAVGDEAIRDEIKKALEKRVGHESPILGSEIWPESPEKVPEQRDHHVLVVLSPEFPFGAKATEGFVATLFNKAGTGMRTFPGAILVLAPDREELYALQNKVKRLLALRDVQKRFSTELSAEDQKRLERDLRTMESDVLDGVVRTWRHLALHGPEKPEWIPLSVYARPGLTLASMVIEHLRSANRLADEIAPDNLLRLVPVTERKPYKDVWAAFLSFPKMPIVSQRAVREAIKRAVLEGKIGLEIEGRIYFQEEVPDAYLDEAWLLSPAEVPQKEEAVSPPAAPKAEPLKVEPKPAPPERPKTTYSLRAKVSWLKMNDIYRGVIIPLGNRSDNLELIIEIRAKKSEGIPKDVIERTVRETLRQINAQILEEREE
jgi:hypothetical protein